jgi:hypothetical protein
VGSEGGGVALNGDSAGRSVLSCCRGASLIVTVYLRRQWLLSDCLSDPDTSTASQQGSATAVNVLHIGDSVVGRAVVDLSMLALGMVVVCGWYHLIDATHTQAGQIFLSVSLPPASVLTRTGRNLGGVASLSNVRNEQPYTSIMSKRDVYGERDIKGWNGGIVNEWEEERWKEDESEEKDRGEGMRRKMLRVLISGLQSPTGHRQLA